MGRRKKRIGKKAERANGGVKKCPQLEEKEGETAKLENGSSGIQVVQRQD